MTHPLQPMTNPGQCPHVRTSDEGTSYCELAEQTAADHSAPKGHDREGAIAQMAQNAPDGLTEEKMWYPAFADWLEHELPEGTVIGDPLWWASKIADYFARYGSPAVAPVAHIGPMVDGVPCDFTRTLLRPAYEPGDGSADGAQLVNLAWWHPAMGCDSLQIVVDNARAIIARYGRPAVAPVAKPKPEANRDAVIAAVAEALGNAYDCLRNWEAWRFGTMVEDDFVLVTEDLDRVAEIADAAIEAMRPAVAPVAVADRQPTMEAGDLDNQGRCWWGDAGGEQFVPSWRLCERPEDSHFTHWRPHWAIPLPTTTQEPKS